VQNSSLESWLKSDQVQGGRFCKFFTDSLIFVFQSKHSNNLGQRECLFLQLRDHPITKYEKSSASRDETENSQVFTTED
jgi:hypothetical protein